MLNKRKYSRSKKNHIRLFMMVNLNYLNLCRLNRKRMRKLKIEPEIVAIIKD